MFSVDVIIPTYKPTKELFEILNRIKMQTVKPRKIILLNTEEGFFDTLVYGTDFYDKHEDCEIHHISKYEFDHGATRNKAVKLSDADYFIMMTQDALPAGDDLFEKLLQPFTDENVAVSYAKQLPRRDCNPVERYTRAFNYPENSRIKGEDDVPNLGIKTYFCSDVCAAYNRLIFDQIGGFVKKAIFNEDMLYAAKAAKAGYNIAYCADARVYHSHNYTAGQQFHRNFDLGVSQAEHPEIFKSVPSEGEGIRMVKDTASYLWNNGYKRYLPRLIIHSAAKFVGYRLGKAYRILPDKLTLKFTSNSDYWKRKRV